MSRTMRPRPCRPRRSAGLCPHGALALVHACATATDDPVVGDPLCPECFDYRGAVLWNAHVPAPVGAHLAPALPRGGRGRPG